LIGQSSPIPIASEFPPGVEGIENINAEEGQSLQDIAEAHGVDPGLVDNLNPGLGEEPLPGGSSVVVPSPPNQTSGKTANTPSNAPSPPVPNPPVGIPALKIAPFQLIDIKSLIPGLVRNLPLAPSDLQVGFGDCMIRLRWNDNATNENQSKIWMQALGGPPLDVRTLESRPGTGPAWFEFEAPRFGIYSFWVEVVNALGGQSSEIQWVAVNDASCGEGIASQLEIEALGMYGFMSGGWDRIYCYISLEGAPEKRIPDGRQYFQIDFNGGANIAEWMGGKNRIQLPMPSDEEVTLEGLCRGWIGDTGPFNMGDFKTSIPREHWDDRVLHIRAENYVVDYRIHPLGPTQVEGAFTYLDLTIPAPYNLRLWTSRSRDAIGDAQLAQNPILEWDWEGNAQEIEGFKVYVNDAMMNKIPWDLTSVVRSRFSPGRRAHLRLPTTCGEEYELRMAVYSATAESPRSDPILVKQPPCKRYAEITFERFNFSYIDDGGDCYEAELRFYLIVNKAGHVSKRHSVGCEHDYNFFDFDISPLYLGSRGMGHVFIVPIDPLNPFVTIKVLFRDYDDVMMVGRLSSLLCEYQGGFQLPVVSDQEWHEYYQGYVEPCPNVDWKGIDYDGIGTIEFYIRGISAPERE